MVNGISSADDRFLASEWFPSQPDARLESRFVQLNAEARVAMNAQGAACYRGRAGDEELGTRNVKVRLTVLRLGSGRNNSPGKP